jgi:hypothetical protein
LSDNSLSSWVTSMLFCLLIVWVHPCVTFQCPVGFANEQVTLSNSFRWWLMMVLSYK